MKNGRMGSCFGNPVPREEQDALKQQREANKKINDQIKQDRRRFKATHRLLLLGMSYVFVQLGILSHSVVMT